MLASLSSSRLANIIPLVQCSSSGPSSGTDMGSDFLGSLSRFRFTIAATATVSELYQDAATRCARCKRINDVCPCSNETWHRLGFHRQRTWNICLVHTWLLFLPSHTVICPCHSSCHLREVDGGRPNVKWLGPLLLVVRTQPRFGVQ